MAQLPQRTDSGRILLFTLDPQGIGKPCREALANYLQRRVDLTDSSDTAILGGGDPGTALLIIDASGESIQAMEVLITVATRAPERRPMLLLTPAAGHGIALDALAYGVLDTLAVDNRRDFLRLLPPLAERLLVGDVPMLPAAGHALHQGNTYRRLLATTTDGLFAMDPAGLFLDLNPGFLRTTGFTRGELLGKPVNKLFTDSSVAALQDQFDSLQGDDFYWAEAQVATKHGQTLHLELVGMVFHDQDQSFLLSSIRDRTEFLALSQALRDSEERYRTMFEATPIGLGLIDEDWNLVAYNQAFAQSRGYNATELLGQPISRVVPEDIWPVVARFIQAAAQGETITRESRNLTKSGAILDVVVHCRPYEFKGRRQLLAATQDVTERNRMLRSLVESEARFREIFHSPAIALAVISRAGRVVEVNDATCRLYGYSRDEMLALHRDAYLLPESRARVRRYNEQGQATAGQERVEIRCKDGAILPVQVFIAPFPYQGEPHFLVVSYDISDAVRTEQELRQSRQRLLLQFEQSPLATIELDLSGTVVDWNPAARKLFGHAREQGIGQNIVNLLAPPEALENGLAIWTEVSQGKHFRGLQAEVLTRQKKRVTCEWFINPLRDEAGQTVGFMGIARDITEQRELERQVLHAQKIDAIGQLTGGIAHDFNNILTGVLGYAELARQRLRQGNQFDISRYLDNIVQAGERARDLVRHLLAYSRAESADFQPIDPLPVVREVVQLLQSTLPATVILSLDSQAEAGLVRADAVQLHQVLLNLCLNAKQSLTSEHGRLGLRLSTIRLRKALCGSCQKTYGGEFVNIAISDNGVGLDADTREKMFDPFFTTKRAGEGTGMGLAVVHGLVHQHGGHIMVRSRPGQGCTVEVRLPRVTEAITGEQASGPGATARGGERQHLLVVDDEPTICAYLKELLEEHGYQVSAFTSASAALGEFQRQPGAFQLVLSDYTMPEMTGAEVAARILQQNAKVPVLLMTGYTDAFDEGRARELGIRRLFNKPLDAKILLEEVHQQLSATGEKAKPPPPATSAPNR